MCSDDGHEETVTDIVTLQKDSQRIEHLGLTLREAKQRLCRKFCSGGRERTVAPSCGRD
jgi:hypothetical protein